MGQSAESMAAINAIARDAQDRWAMRSHANAARGWEDGRLALEVAPVYRNGHSVTQDGHIRRDTTLEKLATLRPVFDRADQLLIAPAYAIPLALKRAGLTLSDISLIEMHEAFAAQVLSTFHVLEQNGAGRVDEDTVNVMGGSIALGHPFGATGARLVTTLANEMRRRGVQFGLASACAAGGNGAAIVLELLA